MIFSIKSFQLNSEKICKLLQQLTECPILSQIEFNTIIKNLHGNQNIFVYMDENENILGMCSIMIEQKIIHGGNGAIQINHSIYPSTQNLFLF